MRLPALLACLALGAGALAGCGGSSDSGSVSKSSTPAKPTTPAKPAPQPSGGGTVKVSMKNIKFNPKAATAKVGQKIVWTNDDPVAHTVTAQSGATFDSGTVAPGQTYTTTVTKAGTISYLCQIHPGQTGTIVVR